MNTFQGQGVFIFNMSACSGVAPIESEAAMAHMLNTMLLAGLAWAAPKVSDGVLPYNRRAIVGTTVYNGPDDILPAFYQAMTAVGKPRLGWQYLYGNYPIQEADTAIAQIRKYDLQGFILDPEIEYEAAGRDLAARQYMGRVRQACPNVPIALCSWRFPSYHPKFPWSAFLDNLDASRGDVHMPQVYWEGDMRPNGASEQLSRSRKELLALKALQFCPVGSAYGNRQNIITYWLATAAQMSDFSKAAKAAGDAGISWWAWDTMAAKDAVDPSQPGNYGWWKTVAAEAASWGAAEPPEVEKTTWSQALTDWARGQGYTGPDPEKVA